MNILVNGAQWTTHRAGRLNSSAPFPPLTEDATLLWHASSSATGVASLSGNPSHAAALIERRLRNEGALEGDAKVFVLKVVSFGKSYQALYATAPMAEWQALQAWVNEQPCHCLVVPAVGALLQACRPGLAAVLLMGGTVLVLAQVGRHLLHASAVAFSDSPDDLGLTLHGLGQALAEDARRLGTEDAGPIDTVYCYPAIFRGEAEALAATLGNFLKGDGVRHEVIASSILDGNDGERVCSALPRMGEQARVSGAINTDWQKALFLASKYAHHGWTGLIAVGALGFLAALYFAIAAHREFVALEHDEEATHEQADLDRLRQQARMPADLDKELIFLRSIDDARHKIDPGQVLIALRQASGTDIRILRVRSSLRKEVAPQASPITDILVDGALPADSGVNKSRLLSEFVKQLERQGYTVSSVESRQTASPANGTGDSAGLDSTNQFSYRLTRQEATR